MHAHGHYQNPVLGFLGRYDHEIGFALIVVAMAIHFYFYRRELAAPIKNLFRK